MAELANYKAYVDDKGFLIREHLEGFPPTIVLSRPEGIYVFAHRVTRLPSTIVLAGAGQTFVEIETWLRKQISELVLGWGPNVPKASREINLLPPLFSMNLDASDSINYSELILVEIDKKPEDDYIAKVDFEGNIILFEGGHYAIISHKNRPPEEDESVGSDDDSEGDKDEEKSAEADADRDDEFMAEVQKELRSLGIDPALFDEPAAFGTLLDQLKAAYPGNGGFLDREKFQAKEFPWIYRIL